jgi:hypothetical protein
LTDAFDESLYLPGAATALARARRRLTILRACEYDETKFRDELPYVLDLLSAVTGNINEESEGKGRRTVAFSQWWFSLSVQLRQEIKDLRNAELRRFESRTARHIDVVVNALAKDFTGRPGQPVNDGDTVTTVTWCFNGGTLDGYPVLPTLQKYLDDLVPILAEAEKRMGQRD